jgi:hypothetical protein
MATRRDIRENFYAQLETAVSSHIPASSISQERPEDEEDLPAVVHNDNYREVPMNRGQGPTDVTRDGSGAVTSISWSDLQQARFSVTILSEDEQLKEDAYEDLVSFFGEYEHPIKDSTELHADCFDVSVGDTTSDDTDNRDPKAFGDVLTIDVSFERYHTLTSADGDFETISEVEHLIDADNDGTTDISYTTT